MSLRLFACFAVPHASQFKCAPLRALSVRSVLNAVRPLGLACFPKQKKRRDMLVNFAFRLLSSFRTRVPLFSLGQRTNFERRTDEHWGPEAARSMRRSKKTGKTKRQHLSLFCLGKRTNFERVCNSQQAAHTGSSKRRAFKFRRVRNSNQCEN